MRLAPDAERSWNLVDPGPRADIQHVTSILGEVLQQTEGRDFVELVESIRSLDTARRAEVLAALELPTATRLARALTAYFHLANTTEQVHRARGYRRRRASAGGWLERAVGRVAATGTRPEDLTRLLQDLVVQPVLTAHPTEVARRSRLDKLRRIAELLELPTGNARTRRLREAIELPWLTDEVRVESSQPLDEARNGVYQATGDGGRPRPVAR